MIVADRVEQGNQSLIIGNESIPPETERKEDPGGTGLPSEVLDLEEAPLPFRGADFGPPAPDVEDVAPTPRALDYSWREPVTRQVADWLRVFVGEGQVVEMRALNVERLNGAKTTYSGFFNRDGLEKMAEAALYWTADAEGTYFTLNPLETSLLARRYNKVEQAKDTAADVDVLRRRWLLVDADPCRKSGISATDEEKRSAWQTLRQVHGWLREQGWPEPVVADSGNGYHLLYRIELPRDDGGLVKSVLEALAARFDDDRVKIDTKVFNPSRIVKLYGTVARKGASIRERPHRRTGVLAIPGEVTVVPRERLEAVGRRAVQKAAAVMRVDPTLAVNSVVAGNRAEMMDRARRYLEKVPPAVSGQSGHNQTFKVACILTQRFGLTEDESLTVVAAWNSRCQPPWDEKDLRKKLKDAARQPARVQKTNVLDFDPVDLPTAREADDDPHRLARLFLDKTRATNGVITVRTWNGEWYRWEGGAYRGVSDGEMTAEINLLIKGEFDRLDVMQQLVTADTDSQDPAKTGSPARTRKVTAEVVNNTLHALRAQTIVKGDVEPPAWLDGVGPFPASEALSAKNALIHLPSLADGREYLSPLTPRFFTTVALDYEIDRDAAAPVGWLNFLKELWPDDPQSIDLLQEWFGYCLTQDTGQQKMLMVIGPKRAGKGTIARVLAALVGNKNVAGPTLGSLAGEFGLSVLIGKPVAIISDARFSGRGSDQAVVVERLLSVSGEDTLSINRKNREHLTIKLPTRITVMTNEAPRLNDASAALPSRLLVLRMKRTWYGQEDTGLGARLIKERSGIFLWAVEGLKRLRTRGRFVQPESGQEELNNLIELASPVTAFVQDQCRLGEGASVAKRSLFDEWRRWCTDSGHEPGNMATFGRNLHAAFPEIRDSRPREGNCRVTSYVGVGLARL